MSKRMALEEGNSRCMAQPTAKIPVQNSQYAPMSTNSSSTTVASLQLSPGDEEVMPAPPAAATAVL